MSSIDVIGTGDSRRYRARWRTPDGMSRSRDFVRKVDAQRFLISVGHQQLTGAYADPSAGKVTFHDFAERWRAMQPHRPGTAKSVEQQLRLHVYPTLGGRRIASIVPSDVQALVQHLGASLSPGTVEVVYGRVVAIFRAAVRDRVISQSPCVAVRRAAAAPSSTLQVLTSEQVTALAAAVPDRYRALVVTGAGTGLRPAELFGLTVDRLDFLRRT